jgi:hypothetical protein
VTVFSAKLGVAATAPSVTANASAVARKTVEDAIVFKWYTGGPPI